MTILHNVSQTGGRHWLGLILICEEQHSPVGARVVIETACGRQTKFAKGGARYPSPIDPRLDFGLGDDTKIDWITIHGPSGKSQEIQGIKPDVHGKVTERVRQRNRDPLWDVNSV